MIQNEKKALPIVSECRQMELFSNFFGTGEYSNTADLWDSAPKHCVSARKQIYLRDPNGRLPVFEHTFEHLGVRCRVEIFPALVKEEGGEHKDYYPSTDEELVEEVLRKLFTDQRYGIHDAFENESWVKFTLSTIRSELKAKGKTRSLKEIKKSLEIMALTNVRIYVDGNQDAIYTGSIISDVLRVNREKYLDNGAAMWAARLPALVSKSVNDHTYRQFNYAILMKLKHPFSRWLHKRLSQRYTYSTTYLAYSIALSTLQRDSGFLSNPKISLNAKLVEQALEELEKAEVILDWEKKERRGGRNRLEDVIYEMTGHPRFNDEMKKINERHKMIDEEFKKNGLTSKSQKATKKSTGRRGYGK